MNERIKELAEQNGFIHNWMPSGEQYELLQRYEKFAKLIIKECEQVSLQNSHRDDDMGAIIARKIKQHFDIDSILADIHAGAELMAGDGGYSESTKEKYEAAVKQRIGDNG